MEIPNSELQLIIQQYKSLYGRTPTMPEIRQIRTIRQENFNNQNDDTEYNPDRQQLRI